MKKNYITVKTKKEFIDYLNRIDDFEFITNNDFKFIIPDISIKLDGKNFKSSLTGGIIEGLYKYQQTVYKIYRQNKYGIKSKKKLTPKEVEQLEIKVTIKEGSTDAILSFVYNLMEAPNMTEQTIRAIAFTAIGAWLIKSLAVPAIKGAFKHAQLNIEAQKEKAKEEKESKYYEQTQASLKTVVESFSEVCKSVIQSKPEKILIDKKEVKLSDIENSIQEIIISKKKEDELEKHYSVEGYFKVLNLNYEKDITEMKALHIKSNEIYNEISLQNDWITEENYNTIIEAEHREPIYFKILVDEKGKKRKCYIDVNSIGTAKIEHQK